MLGPGQVQGVAWREAWRPGVSARNGFSVMWWRRRAGRGSKFQDAPASALAVLPQRQAWPAPPRQRRCRLMPPCEPVNSPSRTGRQPRPAPRPCCRALHHSPTPEPSHASRPPLHVTLPTRQGGDLLIFISASGGPSSRYSRPPRRFALRVSRAAAAANDQRRQPGPAARSQHGSAVVAGVVFICCFAE